MLQCARRSCKVCTGEGRLEVNESTRTASGFDRGPLKALGFIASVAVILAVTKGPVYRLRFERGPLVGDFLDDRWTQSVFCGLYVVAIIALVPRLVVARRVARVGLVMLSPAAILLVATIWSPHRDRAVQQALMMALGTLAAIAIGAAQRPLSLVWAVWTAMVIGLGWSLLAGHFDWVLARDLNGHLVGIYFNKNSFGPVAVTAGLASLGLIGSALGSNAASPRRAARLVAGVVTIPIAATLAIRTGSLTPMVGLVVALVASFAVVTTADRMRRRSAADGTTERRRADAMWVVLVPLAGLVTAASVAVGVHRAGRVSTVADRVEIWTAVSGFIARRPIGGWGLMAVWLEDDMSARIQVDGGRVIHEAHNGYLEMALGGGVLALTAVVAAVVTALVVTFRLVRLRPGAEHLWLFAVGVYAAAVNMGETYFGANLLPWILLVAVASGAARALDDAAPNVTVCSPQRSRERRRSHPAHRDPTSSD